MALLVSKVPRSLEARTRVFGFELGDLLCIFFYLALSNLVFGATVLRVPLVWCVSAALAVTLYVTKKGKPEHFLEHTLQSMLSPGVYLAGLPDLQCQPLSVERLTRG
jgi:hypothetical protein